MQREFSELRAVRAAFMTGLLGLSKSMNSDPASKNLELAFGHDVSVTSLQATTRNRTLYVSNLDKKGNRVTVRRLHTAMTTPWASPRSHAVAAQPF